MSHRSGLGHNRGSFVATILSLLIAASCGEDKNDPKTGSNSNWLIACVGDTTCGDVGACLCGACSRDCRDDSDCDGLAGARCFSAGSAASTQCGGSPAQGGLCLPACLPGSCASGQSCVDGGCVLAEVPGTEFCAPTTTEDVDQRANEDDLLSAIQRNRVAGSIACDSGGAVDAAPPLRLDGRLRCAARIRALDQAESGMSGPVDSLGRDAAERIGLAGYPVSSWWESYAFDAASVADAYALLLADADSCPELGNPAYAAVGVGNVADVFVVTLASD